MIISLQLPKFLKSQSNQSLVFCELTHTCSPNEKPCLWCPRTQKAPQTRKSGTESSCKKNFFFHTFTFQPQEPSQKTYFWSRWPRQDPCTARPWKWEVSHGALGCKSFNWGRYQTKNALEKVERKELNMPTRVSMHQPETISWAQEKAKKPSFR